MPPKCVSPAWLQAILKPRGDLLILAITSLKGRLRPDYHNCLGSAIYAARARLRDAECGGFRYYGNVTTTTATQENVPYEIHTNVLYANTYNDDGALVSQRRHVFSTQTGGDPYAGLGYNM